MHTHRHTTDSGTLLAFLAGAATATLIGGYYLFGKDGKTHRLQVERGLLHAKAEILDRMRQTQDLTEEKYRAIVDQVIGAYTSAKEVGSERAAEAASEFKRKWDEMRDMAARAAEKAREELAEERKEDLRLAVESQFNREEPV